MRCLSYSSKRILQAALLVVLVVLLISSGSDSALACGDKLLALSRSIALYKAYTPWRTASILIYEVHSGSLLKDKQFQSSLKLAGHKIKVLDSAAQLGPVLKSGKFDLVLAEIADAESLKQQIKGPSILPILSKPTKNELTAAEKQYPVVMKLPMEFTEHLQAIDRMMKLRST
jgi:hypothetical protein